MLVSFTCKSYETITMFGDIAQTLIRMMGHSGEIPGAISKDDVSFAYNKLKNALEFDDNSSDSQVMDKDAHNDDTVSLKNRALPLLQMLKSAEQKSCSVSWDAY